MEPLLLPLELQSKATLGNLPTQGTQYPLIKENTLNYRGP